MKTLQKNQLVELKSTHEVTKFEMSLYLYLQKIDILPDIQYLVTGFSEDGNKMNIKDIFGKERVIKKDFMSLFVPSKKEPTYYKYSPVPTNNDFDSKQLVLSNENLLEAEHKYFISFKHRDKYVLYTISKRMICTLEPDIFYKNFKEYDFLTGQEIDSIDDQELFLSIMSLAVDLGDEDMFNEYSQRYSAVKQ